MPKVERKGEENASDPRVEGGHQKRGNFQHNRHQGGSRVPPVLKEGDLARSKIGWGKEGKH